MYLKILLFIFCLSLSLTGLATDDTVDTTDTITPRQTSHTAQPSFAIASNLNNQKQTRENRNDSTNFDHIKWTKSFIVTHQGLGGLIKYADALFGGDILNAYNRTASHLDEETFERLKWKVYESELDYIREKFSFFYTGRRLNKEVLNFGSQKAYAFLYHKGNLAKAFHSGRLILSDRKTTDFIDRNLEWVNFSGTTIDFYTTQNILYDKNNNLRPEYKNLSGQIRAAREHFGSIQEALHIAQATNPNPYSYDLKSWVKGYTGSAESLTVFLELLKEEYSRLKQSNNNTKESQYTGIEGQIILGEKTGTHNMLTLYNNIKSLNNPYLNEIPYKIRAFLIELSETWIPFDGSLQQFEVERAYFLNEERKPHPDILTMKGLAELAKRHYNGKMKQAFDAGKLFFKAHNISISSLLWIKTEMDSETFLKEHSQLLNRDGTVKDKYKYPQGLARYAKDSHNGDMNRAYHVGKLLIHDILPPANELQEYTGNNVRLLLGWISSAQMKSSGLFWKYYKILFDKNGKPKKEWMGVENQMKFAKKYTKGKMLNTWQIQLYISGDIPGRTLQWIPDFEKAEVIEGFIKNFFDQNGQLKEKYKKQNGYLIYAAEHTKRNLSEAYTHSTYLPASIQKILNWYSFNGSIEDYNRDYSIFRQYPEMEGLIKFTAKFYKNSISTAYNNALAFFNNSRENLYRATGWLPFPGIIDFFPPFVFNDTVNHYKRIKAALITENGSFNPLYQNMEGYVRFANKFYDGHMYVAYHGARAVLEVQDIKPVTGWTHFKGHTDEYKEMRDFVLRYQPADSPSERPRRHDKEVVNSFMREKKILPIYKREHMENIQTVLLIHRPELAYGICERGFIR